MGTTKEEPIDLDEYRRRRLAREAYHEELKRKAGWSSVPGFALFHGKSSKGGNDKGLGNSVSYTKPHLVQEET